MATPWSAKPAERASAATIKNGTPVVITRLFCEVEFCIKTKIKTAKNIFFILILIDLANILFSYKITNFSNFSVL